MKILPISDLHSEFFKTGELVEKIIDDLPDADVLVLAGDIDNGRMKGINNLAEKYKHVIYIAGNHEHYGNIFGKVYEKIKRNAASNVIFAEKETVIIEDIKFHCSTLWTDINNANPFHILETTNFMADFQHIHHFDSNVWLDEHRKTMEWMNSLDMKGDVVVTHHAPCELSVHEIYKGSSANFGFYCDLSEFIFEKKPKLWIHGHMHHKNDYVLGDTRIVSNPLGYVKYNENSGFSPEIIEV